MLIALENAIRIQKNECKLYIQFQEVHRIPFKKKKKIQDFDNNARAIFTEIVTIPSLKEQFYSRKANQLVRKHRDGNN